MEVIYPSIIAPINGRNRAQTKEFQFHGDSGTAGRSLRIALLLSLQQSAINYLQD
jgi:hypothetical protein